MRPGSWLVSGRVLALVDVPAQVLGVGKWVAGRRPNVQPAPRPGPLRAVEEAPGMRTADLHAPPARLGVDNRRFDVLVGVPGPGHRVAFQFTGSRSYPHANRLDRPRTRGIPRPSSRIAHGARQGAETGPPGARSSPRA